MQKEIRFSELVDDVYKLVTSFLRKHVGYYSEDLLQDLVLKIYERFDKYDSSKANFSTFVYMNCKNYYLMSLANKKEVCSLDDEVDGSEHISLIDTIPDESDLSLDVLIKEERYNYLRYIYENKCSSLLKDYLNGMTQKELAIKYKRQQSNISVSIRTELNKLKETYGK